MYGRTVRSKSAHCETELSDGSERIVAMFVSDRTRGRARERIALQVAIYNLYWSEMPTESSDRNTWICSL